MLKKIIMGENKNADESKKIIEEFLIPEFEKIHEKSPDIDCLMIDFEKTEKDAHKQLTKYKAYKGDKYEVEFYCPTCGRQEIIEVEKSEQKKFKCDCLEKQYAEIKFTYKKENKELVQEAS